MNQLGFDLTEKTIEFAYQRIRNQFVANVGQVKKESPPTSFFYERGLVKGKIELNQEDNAICVVVTVGTPSFNRWLFLLFVAFMIAAWFININYVIIVIMITIIALFPRTLGGDARREFFEKEVLPNFCDSLGGTNLQKL